MASSFEITTLSLASVCSGGTFMPSFKGRKATINGGLSAAPHQRISDARAVLAYSPELAVPQMQGLYSRLLTMVSRCTWRLIFTDRRASILPTNK